MEESDEDSLANGNENGHETASSDDTMAVDEPRVNGTH
jgi:hypothetical protein